MKLFVLAFTILVSSAFAQEFQNVDIDWSTVRPILYYPKFWDNKPAILRPSPSFFENYENSGLIIGGRPAVPHQFPYQAAVLSFIPDIGGNALCGGTLLGTRTILTAAHCVDGATSGTVVLGAHVLTNQAEPNQRRIPFLPNAILIHPDWNALLVRNDVAIVHLPSAAPLIPGAIRPAILPALSDINYDFAGEDGVASGWGVTNSANPVASDTLNYVYDNVLTHNQCAVSGLIPGMIQPSNICMTGTGNRGVCNGDSGGPLTVRRGDNSMQVGIASFVIIGCENTLPSVFVRVTSFLQWILLNVH